jgi:hypothetical protein
LAAGTGGTAPGTGMQAQRRFFSPLLFAVSNGGVGFLD